MQSHEAATLCHVIRLLKKDLVSVNKLDLDLRTPRVAFESQKDEQKAGSGAAVGVIRWHLWGGAGPELEAARENPALSTGQC